MTENTKNSFVRAVRQAWNGAYAAARIVAYAPASSPGRQQALGELRAWTLTLSALTGRPVEDIVRTVQDKIG